MAICVCRLLKKIERDIDPEKERDLKIREGAALEKLEKKQAKKVRHISLCPMTRNDMKIRTPALCMKKPCGSLMIPLPVCLWS